jgi:hypothetical protein
VPFLLRFGKTYFFYECALFIDGKYIGSGTGSGEAEGRVFECYGGGVVLRLNEDGYVNYEDGLEVGLLRDCGGAVEVKDFEDGRLYIYRSNICGNGVFMGLSMPVVYSDLDQPMAMAILGSIFLIVAGSIRGT